MLIFKLLFLQIYTRDVRISEGNRSGGERLLAGRACFDVVKVCVSLVLFKE